MTNFDLALNCPASSCPLNSMVDQTYLNQLDASFNSAVPEPSTWALMLLGLAGLGAAGRRVAVKQAT